MRISRAVASMSASVSRPLPRRPVKTLSRRSERVSNTARPQKSRARDGPRHLTPGYRAAQAATRARTTSAAAASVPDDARRCRSRRRPTRGTRRRRRCARRRTAAARSRVISPQGGQGHSRLSTRAPLGRWDRSVPVRSDGRTPYRQNRGASPACRRLRSRARRGWPPTSAASTRRALLGVHRRARRVADVEAVDGVGAEGLDPGRGDVEPLPRDRRGEPVEQPRPVAGAHLDDAGRGPADLAVVPGDPRRGRPGAVLPVVGLPLPQPLGQRQRALQRGPHARRPGSPAPARGRSAGGRRTPRSP